MFDRLNLFESRLSPVEAHGGEGCVDYGRIAEATMLAGACNFIDYVVLPSGASIGRHRHADDEEEFYLVLEGQGEMWRDGTISAVRRGDLIRNRPGAAHGLVNTGEAPLGLFVFELEVRR